MRYVKIFLLHFEQVLEYRSRVFVWFLIGFINSVTYFIFWKGALTGKGSEALSIRFSDIASYYFLLIIAGAILFIHIEEDVAYWDIQLGGLSRFLLKPFSYFRIKFLDEIAWRIGQGILSVLVVVIFALTFGNFFTFTHNPLTLFLALLITIFAYFLSFTYKMIIGILTFWFTDYQGLQQLTTVIFFIFAGFVIPLEYLPGYLYQTSIILPFAYMIYYPIRAFQGLLTMNQLISVIGIQMVWLVSLLAIYNFFWRKGVKEFTGVGQ